MIYIFSWGVKILNKIKRRKNPWQRRRQRRKGGVKKNLCQEILCLPYAEFFLLIILPSGKLMKLFNIVLNKIEFKEKRVCQKHMQHPLVF